MSQPTDRQVWAAMDEGQREVACWRIIEFRGKRAIATNDRQPVPLPSISDALPVTITFERHDFEDATIARRYIEWRGIKAALARYEAIRK